MPLQPRRHQSPPSHLRQWSSPPGVAHAGAVVAALLLVLLALPATAADYVGRIVKIADGDTATLLIDGKMQMRLRLAEIDAPENSQPYGKVSKRILSDLIFGQFVTARVTDIDRYGRVVARIDANGLDVNAEMVRRGAAWAYTRYQSDGRFPQWEREARAARRGLWGLQADQILPPWEWRAAKRGVPAVSTTAQALALPPTQSGNSSSAGFSCAKRRCSQMNSCAEALYSFRQCAVGSLDGDGDGKPCEKLCS